MTRVWGGLVSQARIDRGDANAFAIVKGVWVLPVVLFVIGCLFYGGSIYLDRVEIAGGESVSEDLVSYQNPFRLKDFQSLAYLVQNANLKKVPEAGNSASEKKKEEAKTSPKAQAKKEDKKEKKEASATTEKVAPAPEAPSNAEVAAGSENPELAFASGGVFLGAFAPGLASPILQGPSRSAEPAKTSPTPETKIKQEKPGSRPTVDYFYADRIFSGAIVNVNSAALKPSRLRQLPFVGDREIARHEAYREQRQNSLVDANEVSADREPADVCQESNVDRQCSVEGEGSNWFNSKEEFYDVLGIEESHRAALNPLITLSDVGAPEGLYPVYLSLQPFSGSSFSEKIYVGSNLLEALPAPYENNARYKQVVALDGAAAIEIHFADFQTEEGFDFVTFSDDASSQGGEFASFSGEAGSFSVAFNTDRLAIDFESDDSITASGYSMDYLQVWYSRLPSFLKIKREINLVSQGEDVDIEDLIIQQAGATLIDIRLKDFFVADPGSFVIVEDGFGRALKTLGVDDNSFNGYLFGEGKRPLTDALVFKFSSGFQGRFSIDEYGFKPEVF